MRKFNPWPYQKRMIQFALQHPRCGLFVPMGMGKTSASLAIIDVLKTYSRKARRSLLRLWPLPETHGRVR